MDNSLKELYGEIFRRKSVRKYSGEALDEIRLEAVKAFIGELPALQEGVAVDIEIVPLEEMASVFGVEAPHYALVYASPSDAGRLEAGFRVQLLSLCLTAVGMGSRILGMGKPKKPLRAKDSLEYVIMLAFGPTDEVIFREREDFVRKPLEKVGAGSVPPDMLEAVRCAPSAMNGQPWYLTGNSGEIHVWKTGGESAVKGLLTGSYRMIDVGIAISHMYLASLKEGTAFRFDSSSPMPYDRPKGATWVGAVARSR